MKAIFNSAVRWYLKNNIKAIHKWMNRPHQAQERVFQYLIQKGKATEWGKKHNYSAIKNYDPFKAAVPVSDYDDMKPFIERMMQGEQHVLWPEKINWFSKSSGTTSDKSKFIPVSPEALSKGNYKAGKDILSLYFYNNPSSKLFTGKGLIMGGSHQVHKLNKNTRYGDISAVMLQNMPWLGKKLRAPSMKTALMDDWEEKLQRIAAETLKQRITHIAGVPTWTVVLIKRLFEITGKNDLKEIWPHLELYIHGGVSFAPYRQQFRELIKGDEMQYYETYNASEGFFGIQGENNADDMLLLLDHGIFYEFMPVEEDGKDHPKTLQLSEVEVNKNYALIISTNAGLWRYKIGDTVRFTSLSPYKIQVSGRLKHYINAFGEEVIVENTDKALQLTCEATGAIAKDYTAAPIYLTGQSRGGHEWLIEFEKEPDDLQDFTRLLDKNLQSLNSDYEAKRSHGLALKLPVVHSLPSGTFYKWMKSRGKLGGQNKVPRLSNGRDYVEEILESFRK